MKKLSTLLLTGALVFGFGTATGFAGDRVPLAQGRAGYRLVEKQDRATTVAVYTGERREATKTVQTDREPQHTVQSQGRAGYKHTVSE